MPFSYATPADYIKILTEDEGIEQSNLDFPTAEMAINEKLSQALVDASSEINVILGTRYIVPIVPTPTFLKFATVIIAWYYRDVYSDREHVEKKYNYVIKRLTDIALGKFSLVDDNTSQPIPDLKSSGDGATRFVIIHRPSAITW